MRLLVFLQILCLFLLACGKHEVDSFGFTKENNVSQGQKPKTPLEFIKLAIEQNDKSSFDQILSQGLNVNSVFSNGRTLLLHAIYNQNALFVNELLKRGADASIKDTDGKTAIEVAKELEQGRIEVLLDPNQQSHLQMELFAAISDAENDNVDPQVQALLQEGTNPNFRDSTTGETPLTMAIKNLSLATVRIVNWEDAGFGITVTDVNLPNASGEMPLALAKAIKKPAYKKKFVEALTNKNALEVAETTATDVPQETL